MNTITSVHDRPVDLPKGGFLRNSLVIARDGEADLFVCSLAGVIAQLDGYAVIPMETYLALLPGKSLPTDPPDPSART